MKRKIYKLAALILATTAMLIGSPLKADSRSVGIETAIKATVAISLYDEEDQKIATGSGFILSDGRVATNYHVLEKGYRAEVVSSTGELLLVSDYVEAFSSKYDLAILPKVSKIPAKLNLAMYKPSIGTRVIAIGAPLGLQNTVSDGIVSAHRNDDGTPLLQISAPISPGSSGGPVIGAEGAVVGVAVLTIRGGQNLNFAVPAEALRTLAKLPATKSYIAPKRRLQAEVSVSISPSNPAVVPAPVVEAPPVANGSEAQEIVSAPPVPVAPAPPRPPLAVAEFEGFAITLKECTQHSGARVACDVSFKNSESMGAAKRLSISSTYIEQQGGRSQDKVISIMSGLASPIAWHSGRFCVIQPLGSCEMRFIYSGVNFVPGKYVLNLKLYVGVLGARSVISLPAEHQ